MSMFGIDHDGDGVVSDLDDITTMAILEEERQYWEEEDRKNEQAEKPVPVDPESEKFGIRFLLIISGISILILILLYYFG